jgi:signal transduction histidine kinase
MSAKAASIKVTAENECPALASEAHNLSQMAMAVMRSLRTTLQTLRPPEIDDFGLAASLTALVSDHERRADGKLKIKLDVGGGLQGLPPTAAAHLYRIVQEGLTNISKHANASRARVALSLRPMERRQHASERRWLELTIEDDGCGSFDNGIAEEGSGLGLIGMRERAMALGGQLDVVQLDRSFRLQAVIPFEAAEPLP